MFSISGEIPETRYIFTGNYVNRGYNSVETSQLLLCLKLKYPGHITLLRGNHETRQVSRAYGFYDESLRKYGNLNPWKYCMEVFDYLPIGAVIENEIFCVHAGLSPSISTFDHIRQIDRFGEIDIMCPYYDLVWSDAEEHVDGWHPAPRGAGNLFGWKIVKQFNLINNLNLIVKSHRLDLAGYKYWFKEKNLL